MVSQCLDLETVYVDTGVNIVLLDWVLLDWVDSG